jgi:hypothetical protein
MEKLPFVAPVLFGAFLFVSAEAAAAYRARDW